MQNCLKISIGLNHWKLFNNVNDRLPHLYKFSVIYNLRGTQGSEYITKAHQRSFVSLSHTKYFNEIQRKSSNSPTWNTTGYFPVRHIWGWLNSIFNKVDESRILDAGPDRACAEWLLRCGANVKWFKSENWVGNYNSLPIGGARMFKIEEVDASESSIMHVGFPYFKDCKYIRRLVLHKAPYIDDEALKQLCYLKKSLRELQVSSCGNVTREGLNRIKKLSKLEYLLLFDLPLINDKEEVIKDFEKALPKCAVVFPYAQASERPQEEEAT